MTHRPAEPGTELLSIIVPVYNEVRSVREVINRLIAIDLPMAREILIVDDGSSDGTRDVLAGVVSEQLPVTVIHAARNGGKGSAVRLGLLLLAVVAAAVWVLSRDADFLALWE